ncbi:MAG: metal-binding protein [Gammaproteobacteria bacterium]|nr:metal-binding protein [Gammaproteobacteria bacterium]|tara:strand:+ start:184 stop:750 length:567 start_codon:yes stop_codon:yes gene_type:complete
MRYLVNPLQRFDSKNNVISTLWLRACALVALCLTLVACGPQTEQTASAAALADTTVLDVYKSPTCGCCGAWIEHAEARGFQAIVHDLDNDALTREKLQRGITLRLQSCHTSVAEDGSVFEGHIPAHLIHQYLADKPADSIGLTVPGMPIGSPGMEVGDRMDPYDVLLLKADGSTEVYAHVSDQQSQYQ